jgi:hypothetical protein
MADIPAGPNPGSVGNAGAKKAQKLIQINASPKSYGQGSPAKDRPASMSSLLGRGVRSPVYMVAGMRGGGP